MRTGKKGPCHSPGVFLTACFPFCAWKCLLGPEILGVSAFHFSVQAVPWASLVLLTECLCSGRCSPIRPCLIHAHGDPVWSPVIASVVAGTIQVLPKATGADTVTHFLSSFPTREMPWPPCSRRSLFRFNVTLPAGSTEA